MTLLHVKKITQEVRSKLRIPGISTCVFHGNTSFFHENVEEHHSTSRKRQKVRACEFQDKKIAEEEESIVAAGDSIHLTSNLVIKNRF